MNWLIKILPWGRGRKQAKAESRLKELTGQKKYDPSEAFKVSVLFVSFTFTIKILTYSLLGSRPAFCSEYLCTFINW